MALSAVNSWRNAVWPAFIARFPPAISQPGHRLGKRPQKGAGRIDCKGLWRMKPIRKSKIQNRKWLLN
jgi:hypothetical protein